MTRLPYRPHRYVHDLDLGSDWRGRVPCARCGIPEKPMAPKNRIHTSEPYDEPEDYSARILGERDAA